jgi:hypothetical protein
MKLPGEFGIMLQIGAALGAEPIDWNEEEPGSGVLIASKTLRSEPGEYGAISLAARITPESGGFKCYSKVVCPPLGSDQTKQSSTLEEAKELVETMWRTQATNLAHMNSKK